MTDSTRSAVHVTAKDLQGHGAVVCPNPKMAAWSSHPRVFLNVSDTGSAQCPYCGTQYVLDGGATHGH